MVTASQIIHTVLAAAGALANQLAQLGSLL